MSRLGRPIVIPPIVLFGVVHELIPAIGAPENATSRRSSSPNAGQGFLNGAWGWYTLILAIFVLNTVLGEELPLRGYLLHAERAPPRRLGPERASLHVWHLQPGGCRGP